MQACKDKGYHEGVSAFPPTNIDGLWGNDNAIVLVQHAYTKNLLMWPMSSVIRICRIVVDFGIRRSMSTKVQDMQGCKDSNCETESVLPGKLNRQSTQAVDSVGVKVLRVNAGTNENRGPLSSGQRTLLF